MLGTIQFNNDLRFSAIEIHNVIADDLLLGKLHRISTKKVIPQVTFLFGHVPAKFSGGGQKSRVKFGGYGITCILSTIKMRRGRTSQSRLCRDSSPWEGEPREVDERQCMLTAVGKGRSSQSRPGRDGSPWEGEPLGRENYKYRVDRSRCCWAQSVSNQRARAASE